MELAETMLGNSVSISQGPGSLSYPVFPSVFNHFLFYGFFLTIQVQGILDFKNVSILP